MATVPLSGSNIRLLSDVPFSNDYKHTRWFDTKNEQENYFLNKPIIHNMVESNFQRIEGRHLISVNKSIDELWGTNYVMFQNSQYNSKWFYAFVTKLEYVQRNTTYVHFEIDVFQTWKFDMNFKPSYVVREHCKLWNSDGTPVINTVDEGLDYGTDYDVVKVENFTPSSYLYLVIVSKATLHVPDGAPSAGNYIRSTINGTAQPLSFYIVPFSGRGTTPRVKIDGGIWELTSVKDVLNTIYLEEAAVNNIVSMYITPYTGINFYNEQPDLITSNFGFGTQNIKAVHVGQSTMWMLYVEEMLEYSNMTIDCGPKYGGFTSPDESKLLMYPYTTTILEDFRGNRMSLKNEHIAGYNLQVDVLGALGVSNKTAYVPKNYHSSLVASPDDRMRAGLEHALIDITSNDVSIVNDMLAAFLQGNRNSLRAQVQSIQFNGMADAAGAAIGGIAAAFAGNSAGVASGSVGMIKGAGNTELQIRALQAKSKDINNMPPSMVKMGSNTPFDFGNGLSGLWIIKKQIKPEYRKKISDYFKMFGYKVNEVKMPNFHTRQNWNYVQTNSCNITGNFNHEDLQELKNVFDSGITFWHTDDVGNYALANGVIS